MKLDRARMVERHRDNPIQVPIKVGQKCGFVPTHLETNLENEMDAKGVHYNR